MRFLPFSTSSATTNANGAQDPAALRARRIKFMIIGVIGFLFFVGTTVGSILALLGSRGNRTVDLTIQYKALNTASNEMSSLLSKHMQYAPKSNSSFAYAMISSLTIDISSFQLKQKGASTFDVLQTSTTGSTTAKMSGLNLLQSSDAVTMKFKQGVFDALRFSYKNRISVKAFCKTATKFVYTTATGPKALDLSDSDIVSNTMPSDYAAYQYQFWTVDSLAVNPTTITYTNTTQAFNKDITGSLDFTRDYNLIFGKDPAMGLVCYDGVSALNSTGVMSPFNDVNVNGLNITSFFPENVPNFGLPDLFDFYVSSNTEKTSEMGFYGQTLISSENLEDIVGDNLDHSKLIITSIAFDANSLYEVFFMKTRGRTNEHLYSTYSTSPATVLNQDSTLVNNGIDSANVTYWYYVYNGRSTAYITGDLSDPNSPVIRDRVVYIPRIFNSNHETFPNTAKALIINGPDCGKTLTDSRYPELGTRARACLSTPAFHYFKRVRRSF